MTEKRIFVYSGSFNPSGTHHRRVVEAVRATMRSDDKMYIEPCGPRPDKLSTNDIDPAHRAYMADITFAGLGTNVIVDNFDLENQAFTRTWELVKRHESEGEVWYVVGPELLYPDKNRRICTIRECWEHGKELWNHANFVIVVRPGMPFDPNDVPQNHLVIHADIEGSSEEIRGRAANHESIHGLVVPQVEQYIERYNLYRGGPRNVSEMIIQEPCAYIHEDTRNPRAVALAKTFAPHCAQNPNVIVSVGGDGTLLNAVRKEWRRRFVYRDKHRA